MFLEGNITGNPLINNNVFVQATAGAPSNGAIYISQAAARIYNNVFKSLDGSGLGVHLLSSGTILQNNIVDNLNQWLDATAASPDYNDVYSVNSSGVAEGAHSITTNPLLDGSYKLTAGSPCIGTAVDLSGTFTTDKNGATRTAPWDMGAFKYIAPSSATSGNSPFRSRRPLAFV